jgi:serine/threonine-protein kinase
MPRDPLIDTVVAGRYRILRKLGGGAMGSVYLGEHLKFGRLDAIKVLQGGMAHDRESTDRFLRGARNASAINHPNVCTVYDFGDTDDGLQFLAMEFVDGESLADILEDEGPLPLRRGIEITRQIGEALDAAHHLGIVHRDLKPGNVMVVQGRDGRDIVKVVDFDIAKGSAEGEGSEVTRTGFVVGTPEYMSPEQLTGDPLDGRSDVYSLALVFVRIVTGRLPARSTSTQDLMVERLTQDPLRLQEIAPELLVPDGVQAAVDHALQRRREDRPATSAGFIAALVRGARSDGGSSGAATAGSNAPGGAGSRDVPETYVGRPPDAAPGRSTGAPASSGGLRRRAPYLIGGAVVIAAGAVALQLASGGDAPTGGAATGESSEASSTEVASDIEAGSAADPITSDSPPPAGPDRVTTPPATQPPPANPASTGMDDPVVEAPASVTTDPVEEPVPQPPAMSDADAENLLFEEFSRLTDAPGAATFNSVIENATQMWDEERLSDSVRAFAAYLIASGHSELGDTDLALTWASRAVTLAPDNRGFRVLLEQLGGTS